jgi:hypothetical protein
LLHHDLVEFFSQLKALANPKLAMNAQVPAKRLKHFEQAPAIAGTAQKVPPGSKDDAGPAEMPPVFGGTGKSSRITVTHCPVFLPWSLSLPLRHAY